MYPLTGFLTDEAQLIDTSGRSQKKSKRVIIMEPNISPKELKLEAVPASTYDTQEYCTTGFVMPWLVNPASSCLDLLIQNITILDALSGSPVIDSCL